MKINYILQKIHAMMIEIILIFQYRQKLCLSSFNWLLTNDRFIICVSVTPLGLYFVMN